MVEDIFINICPKPEMMHIGGQAVIEGVMMRNKERYAVAVRLPNGKIRTKRETNTKLPAIATLPFIRGIIGLIYMLRDGMKALMWSSNQQLDDREQITKKEMMLTLIGSFIIALVLFVGIPFFIAGLIQEDGFWFNVLDGMIRVIIFLAYFAIIARMNDMKTIFQYHGAEHKAIFCYEAKEDVTIENVQKFPRQHHRCGTSFLFLVLIISIFVFSFITGPWYVRLGGRILLIPVVAGIGYELIKLGDKFNKNPLMKILLTPGIWLQEITTKEPSEKQIEVAMSALAGVVGKLELRPAAKRT